MKHSFQIQIHHVAIQTANFDKAFRFYTEILGLEVATSPYSFKDRTLTWLRSGSIMVELFSMKQNREPQAYNPCRVGVEHIAFEVDNLDTVLLHLKDNGLKILKNPFLPPTNDPLQPRICVIEGADGEEIELREHQEN